ncbi:signal transduction histidine kinase [Pelotomaculum thermopropionicum SI]|uniref:histidine kinase n=1 Tax=Pelotomaculum thermopropionicum (strain DSM 13744 / JCM 10971 / SI) TaxID=370438 RepID=A5D567_PELTS|nr:signal transduction histidine kinase [Pelotomaculum thermopropionicum SI]
MSLRLKLTFLYSGVLALTMLVFGLLVYFFMEHNLTAEADRSVAGIAEDVVRSTVIVGRFPAPLRQVVIPDVDVFANPNTYIQVVDRSGVVAARSDNLGGQVIPLSEETLREVAKGKGFYETVMSGSQSLRVYNRPLLVDGQVVGVLQVARTMGPAEMALKRLRILLFLGGAVALFLTSTLGWLLAGAALRPIGRITETASAIQQGRDLTRRISYSGPKDEVGRLAGTLNQMLERLHDAYRNLEDAEAAQRRFVSDASHELRTPLTTIKGNVELLKKMGDADPETRNEALNDIAGEVERMSRLVSDLLVLARADASLKLKKEAVALAPLLAEAARRGSVLAGGLTFSAGDFSALGEAEVLGDKDYLMQLLLILIENAVRYTPPGGEVRLEAQAEGDCVEISIIDNGIGIAEKDLPHIFERFYRADKVRFSSGSGLGLAIARWIVEEHGGTIIVKSKEGEGSTFTVHLPLRIL